MICDSYCMLNVTKYLFLKKVLISWCIMDMFFPAVVSGQSDALEPSGLMSPCSTVRSLTKELQHSLDLASATSGDKVVTALVSEASVWKPLRWLRLLLCSWLNASFLTWLSRRMRMNSLCLRVDNRLLVLSVHVLTLDGNWRMRSDCCAVCLFKYKSWQKHLQYSPNVCVCVFP